MRGKDFSVDSASLRKTPQLVKCPRWDRVEFLGSLNCRTDLATYDGGLVKYEGKLYYVSRAQIESLRGMVRWNVKKRVEVLG